MKEDAPIKSLLDRTSHHTKSLMRFVCNRRVSLLVLLLSPIFLLIASNIWYVSSTLDAFDESKAFDLMIHSTLRGPSPEIPRIIHQIWIGDKGPPPRFREAAKTWKLKGYSYTLWNYSSIAQLIDQKFPAIAKQWRSYPYRINRVDSAKYIILLTYGGIYADMDIVSLQKDPLTLIKSRFLKNKKVLVVDGAPFGINCEFLVSPPRHPFYARVVRNLYEANRYYFSPWLAVIATAGPLFLTAAYRQFPDKSSIRRITYEEAAQNVFHSVGGGSWYTWDSYLMIHILYFGIVQGKLVPRWITMFILCSGLAILVLCLRRRGYFKKR